MTYPHIETEKDYEDLIDAYDAGVADLEYLYPIR